MHTEVVRKRCSFSWGRLKREESCETITFHHAVTISSSGTKKLAAANLSASCKLYEFQHLVPISDENSTIDGKHGHNRTWDKPPPVSSTLGRKRRVAALATKNLTLLKTNTSSLEDSSGATSLSRLAAISKVVQASQDTPPLTSSPTTSSELVACAASCSSSQVPGASEARGERAGLGSYETDCVRRACYDRSLSLRNATP